MFQTVKEGLSPGQQQDITVGTAHIQQAHAPDTLTKDETSWRRGAGSLGNVTVVLAAEQKKTAIKGAVLREAGLENIPFPAEG